MKNIKLTFLCLFVSVNILFSQINLVPNPSFENISSCPDLNQFSPIELASPWFSLYGTTDVYNKCSKNPIFGVPYNSSNGFSYQPAKTGNGYAGFNIYEHYYKDDKREYISVKLMKNLEKNKKYFTEFWVVNQVDKLVGSTYCFIDAIGVATYEKKYGKSDFKRIDDLVPIVENRSGVIRDSPNWIKVNGTFISQNTDQFLIIGNFTPQEKVQFSVECTKQFPGLSYMFIDDVALYECDPVPDTIYLCTGASKKIGRKFLTSTYKWNTGATDSVITVNKPGRYIVNMNYENTIISDTTYVINPDKDVANILSDTSVCKGDVVKINFPNVGTYTWEDNHKGNFLQNATAGLYAFTITTPCGMVEKTIQIKEEECTCNIFIPTAFSPNGDGINDDLRYYQKCYFDLKVTRFQIFDRWGNHVFLAENLINESIGWDGTFRGELLEQGIYTYSLEYEYTKKGRLIKQIKNGDFVLMR